MPVSKCAIARDNLCRMDRSTDTTYAFFNRRNN